MGDESVHVTVERPEMTRARETSKAMEVKEQQDLALAKLLKPFSGGLPYDRERYQQEIVMLHSMQCLLKYEMGRRLIVMWEQEKKNCANFAQFMATTFPKISKRQAYYAMAYSVKTENCPQFRAFAESKGGWGKALLLMDMTSQEELEEFEKTGEILGITWDDLETKTLKQLQAKLRGLETKHQKELDQEQAANRTLTKKVEDLETALAEPDQENCRKLLEAADEKLHEALQLLRQIPWGLVGNDPFLRRAAYEKCNLVRGTAERIELEIDKATPEEDQAAEVRAYMHRRKVGNLAAGPEAEGKDHEQR